MASSSRALLGLSVVANQAFAPSAVEVFWRLGSHSQSCSEACAAAGGAMTCQSGNWPLNAADLAGIVKTVQFECTGTQMTSQSMGPSMHDYGMCFYAASDNNVQCSTKPADGYRRLCPCGSSDLRFIMGYPGSSCSETCLRRGGQCEAQDYSVWPTSQADMQHAARQAGQQCTSASLTSKAYAPFISVGTCYYANTFGDGNCDAFAQHQGRICPCLGAATTDPGLLPPRHSSDSHGSQGSHRGGSGSSHSGNAGYTGHGSTGDGSTGHAGGGGHSSSHSQTHNSGLNHGGVTPNTSGFGQSSGGGSGSNNNYQSGSGSGGSNSYQSGSNNGHQSGNGMGNNGDRGNSDSDSNGYNSGSHSYNPGTQAGGHSSGDNSGSHSFNSGARTGSNSNAGHSGSPANGYNSGSHGYNSGAHTGSNSNAGHSGSPTNGYNSGSHGHNSGTHTGNNVGDQGGGTLSFPIGGGQGNSGSHASNGNNGGNSYSSHSGGNSHSGNSFSTGNAHTHASNGGAGHSQPRVRLCQTGNFQRGDRKGGSQLKLTATFATAGACKLAVEKFCHEANGVTFSPTLGECWCNDGMTGTTTDDTMRTCHFEQDDNGNPNGHSSSSSSSSSTPSRGSNTWQSGANNGYDSGSQPHSGNSGYSSHSNTGQSSSHGNNDNSGYTSSHSSTSNHGYTSNSGNNANHGYTSSNGNNGNTGNSGNNGNHGYTSTNSNNGNTGNSGNNGNHGYTSSHANNGNTGNDGYTSSQGNSGNNGNSGYTSSPSSSSNPSIPSSHGNTGYTSSHGSSGHSSSGYNNGDSSSQHGGSTSHQMVSRNCRDGGFRQAASIGGHQQKLGSTYASDHACKSSGEQHCPDANGVTYSPQSGDCYCNVGMSGYDTGVRTMRTCWFEGDTYGGDSHGSSNHNGNGYPAGYTNSNNNRGSTSSNNNNGDYPTSGGSNSHTGNSGSSNYNNNGSPSVHHSGQDGNLHATGHSGSSHGSSSNSNGGIQHTQQDNGAGFVGQGSQSSGSQHHVALRQCLQGGFQSGRKRGGTETKIKATFSNEASCNRHAQQECASANGVTYSPGLGECWCNVGMTGISVDPVLKTCQFAPAETQLFSVAGFSLETSPVWIASSCAFVIAAAVGAVVGVFGLRRRGAAEYEQHLEQQMLTHGANVE